MPFHKGIHRHPFSTNYHFRSDTKNHVFNRLVKMPEEQREGKRLEDEEKKKEREATWKEVQEKMKKRSNPLDMAHRREVAHAYEAYLKTLPFNLRQLWLLTLPFKRPLAGVPYAVPRKKIPSLMRTNPKFYEKYREMVIGEEE